MGESKQPDAKRNEAQQAGEYGSSYRRGIDDIKTLGGRAMWVASEFRLPGHPRPTTESQDIWNDDPPRDSTATSIPSHDLIIGIQSGSVQRLPRPRFQPIRLGLSVWASQP